MSKICKICHHENEDNAVICTICGHILNEDNKGQIYNKIEKAHKKVFSIYRKILITVVVIAAILSIYFVVNKNWIGLGLTLLFAIPIIISFLKTMLLNKISNTFLTKIDDFNKNKYK